MNTNHTCHADPHCSNSLNVRLAPFAVDERAVFVHSVCAALIDSRFGPGRSGPLVVHLSDRPELERAVFCDMTPRGPIPIYSILPDSEVARRYVWAAFLSALEEFGLAGGSIRGQSLSPSNLGRGSP